MFPTFQELLLGGKEGFEQTVSLVSGELAGDGNIFERMVSAQGTQGLPEDYRSMIELFRDNGVKPEEVREKLTNLKYNIEHPGEWDGDSPPRKVF